MKSDALKLLESFKHSPDVPVEGPGTELALDLDRRLHQSSGRGNAVCRTKNLQ